MTEEMYQCVSAYDVPIYSSVTKLKSDCIGKLLCGDYVAGRTSFFSGSEMSMAIRRGKFSHCKDGYIPVTFERHSDPTLHMFKHFYRIPRAPMYLTAKRSLHMTRFPCFNGEKGNEECRSLAANAVFEALRVEYNETYTEIGIYVKAHYGARGWITLKRHVLFYETFLVVERPLNVDVVSDFVGSRYVQNTAQHKRLPYRNEPNLQSPRIGGLLSYDIVKLLQRKLIKDQIWLQVQIANDQNERHAFWIIERNVYTGERVMVPWAVSDGFNELLKNRDTDPDTVNRYYCNIYKNGKLPIRTEANEKSEIVAHLSLGEIFFSSLRILTSQRRIWIQLPLSAHIEGSKAYGYAPHSDALTNTLYLKEMPIFTKVDSVRFAQVVTSEPIKAYTTSNDVVHINPGTILPILKSIYKSSQQAIYYEFRVHDIDSNVSDSNSETVHIAAYDIDSQKFQIQLISRNIRLEKLEKASIEANDSEKRSESFQIQFSGRASKLFGLDSVLSRERTFSTRKAAGSDGQMMTRVQRQNVCTRMRDLSGYWRLLISCLDKKKEVIENRGLMEDDSEDEEREANGLYDSRG